MPRITYRYREFKYSKRATFVDKHTHSLNSRILIAFFFTLGVCFPLHLLSYKLPNDSLPYSICDNLITFFSLLALFEPWLIRKLSDRFDWAGKIAAADAKELK